MHCACLPAAVGKQQKPKCQDSCFWKAMDYPRHSHIFTGYYGRTDRLRNQTRTHRALKRLWIRYNHRILASDRFGGNGLGPGPLFWLFHVPGSIRSILTRCSLIPPYATLHNAPCHRSLQHTTSRTPPPLPADLSASSDAVATSRLSC